MDVIQRIRDEIIQITNLKDIHRLPDDECADIDAEALADELAQGTICDQEYVSFCLSRELAPRDEDGEIAPIAAARFLESKWGQEILSCTLPASEEAAAECFAKLVEYARANEVRVWSPMVAFGDINLTDPGRLPPRWAECQSIGGR